MKTQPTTAVRPPAAASRQEFQELIGFLGDGGREVAQIEADLAATIAAAQAEADAKLKPLKAGLAEAQAKVEGWCSRSASALQAAVQAGVQGLEPYQARLAAMLASARPVTARQRMVLKAMQAGAVLRRRFGHRQFDVIWPKDSPGPGLERPLAPHFMTSNHVFDLQTRFLDAFDPASGEALLTASAFDDRPLEFRLKPDVELP